MTVPMRNLTILLSAVLLSRCATAPPADSHPQRMFAVPGDDVTKASANCPLRLDLAGPLPRLIAGTTVRIPFVVRNLTNHKVKSCTVNGPSIRIRSESDGQWRMILMQGKTLDAACSHSIALAPSASESFVSEIPIFNNLPPGPATLDVILGFDGFAYGSRECGEALQWQETVTILAPMQDR
jgi:hypothetical protein